MTATSVTLPAISSNFPPQGSGSVSASFEAGAVTFDAPITLATWASGNMGGVGAKDYVFAVDGRMLARSQGSHTGLISFDAVDATNPDGTLTKRFAIVADWAYFGWAPGRHVLTFGLIKGDYNHVIYNSAFAFDVPATTPMVAQTPSSSLVPGRILRNYFFLTPQRNQTEPGVTPAALRDAGVNCLTVGGFISPGNLTYDQWKSSWNANQLADVDWCVRNGLYALVEMDGLYRSAAERLWWDTCPWRDDALRFMRDALAARRPWAAAVSGNDEVIWSNGVPIDTAALHTLWRANPGAPPWAWPGPNPYDYESASKADYAIRYVSGTGSEFSSKLSATGLGYSAAQWGRTFDQMRAKQAVPTGWAQGVDTSAMSGAYQKLVDGAYMQDGDVVLDEEVLVPLAAAQVWLPLALLRPIPSLVRGYFFDTQSGANARLNAAKGPFGLHQQGVVFGSALWRAMSRAFKSVEARESLLTSRTPLAAAFSDDWATGGVDGLRIAINCAPFARTWEGESVPAGGVWLSDGEVL